MKLGKVKTTNAFDIQPLEAKTPIGRIRVPGWEEKKLIGLTDIELLEKAVKENDDFCISPSTYAMIEKRFLEYELQQLINPNIGMSHLTLRLIGERQQSSINESIDHQGLPIYLT